MVSLEILHQISSLITPGFLLGSFTDYFLNSIRDSRNIFGASPGLRKGFLPRFFFVGSFRDFVYNFYRFLSWIPPKIDFGIDSSFLPGIPLEISPWISSNITSLISPDTPCGIHLGIPLEIYLGVLSGCFQGFLHKFLILFR